MPRRVAALLDVMQISDILSVEGPDTFTRPIYAGNAIATVRTSDEKLVLTVRGTAFGKVPAEGGMAEIEAVSAGADPGTSRFVGSEIVQLDRPELTSARVVVSGGARARLRRCLPGSDRAARRQAGCCHRRKPRCGGRRVCA